MGHYENYKEEFLDDQISLVREVSTNWKFFNYPNKEQLKQTYSAENFTPETRHYAYSDNQLTGFVSSAIEDAEEGRASLQFPFVKPGNETLEAKLMEKAFNKLKEKGANHVISTIPTTWTGAADVLKKYGYSKHEVANKFFLFETSTYDYSSEEFPGDLVEVDLLADREELIRVFSTEMTQTPEEIGQLIDRWPEREDIFTNIIVKKDGKIVSHSMVLRNNNNPERALMTHVSIYDKQFIHYRPLVTKFILQKLKNSGFEVVNFVGIPQGEEDLYNDFNFPTFENIRYRRDL
jgi:hypothetical protein